MDYSKFDKRFYYWVTDLVLDIDESCWQCQDEGLGGKFDIVVDSLLVSLKDTWDKLNEKE